MTETLKAPFPWFGGKSRIAPEVWRWLGEPASYVEPFFGSGAVLLSRPKVSGVETVNDADGLLSNLWRAIQKDPSAVAGHASWPVNEADLHARHLWLVRQRDPLTSRLMADPDWFDAKAAGWWVWGASCWIGSGWCSGDGPWTENDGEFVDARQLPHLSGKGQGINRQLPHLGNLGRGVNRQLPLLGDGGFGVTKADAGIENMMQALSVRLRHVRVACGDWSRIVGDSVLFPMGRVSGGGVSDSTTCGVFLDPPYRSDNTIDYASGSLDHGALEAWCRENGARAQLRIVLCGYEGEYELPGWDVVPWKAHGGYGSQGDGDGRENAARERLWCSPACLKVERWRQPDLLGGI